MRFSHFDANLGQSVVLLVSLIDIIVKGGFTNSIE